jgi:pre-mRNA-splicing factor ISY1
MARPAEKARAMMNKWVAMRDAGNDRPATSRRSKRPYLASECEHLADAERYRGQIIREISEGIAKIQNPGLGEHTIRDLNEEINHKMREKWHWNKRIKELGGLDYNHIERQRQVEEGDTQMRSGYRYFGAAKDLPGVRELLAKEVAKHQKVKKLDLHKNITPDYYGWRDEEDGVLMELEHLATKQNDKQFKRRRVGDDDDDDDDIQTSDEVYDYLNVPSQDDIKKTLLEIKKKALMEKYSL